MQLQALSTLNAVARIFSTASFPTTNQSPAFGTCYACRSRARRRASEQLEREGKEMEVLIQTLLIDQ